MTRIAAFFLLAACGRPTVAGTVTDLEGAPLADARITVVGTLCQGATDAAGRFEVPCQGGEHRVAITQQGYVSKQVDVTLSDGTHDLGAQALVRIPDGEGLFLFEGAGYATMAPSLLEERRSAAGRAWCWVEGGAENPVAAGRVPIFAKQAGDWRVFRLDEEGCARRLERQGAHWKVTYTERPEETTEAVGTEQAVHILSLTPGRYVVVPWEGDFVEDRAASEGGPDRFRAWLLVAGDAPS